MAGNLFFMGLVYTLISILFGSFGPVRAVLFLYKPGVSVWLVWLGWGGGVWVAWDVEAPHGVAASLSTSGTGHRRAWHLCRGAGGPDKVG